MFLEKFIESINKKNMISKGDSIVIAISGGADSIFMTEMLLSIKEKYNLSLIGFHLDHMTRNGDSYKDSVFVKNYLDSKNIPAYIFQKNIKKYSKKMKISFEEAGRLKRYELLNKVLKETKSNKIALGQNLDDQGETLLFRLFRGTGLDGLTGIKYNREGYIIRPILDFSREEIESYCHKNEIKYCQDYTNKQKIYSRNKIRLDIIPYIEKNFNENIKKTLWQTSNLLKEDQKLIDSIVKKYIKDNINKRNKAYYIKIKKFDKELFALKSRVIRFFIEKFNGDLNGVSYNNVVEILDLVKAQNTGKYKIIQGVKFEINYDNLVIYNKNQKVFEKNSKKELVAKIVDLERVNFSNKKTEIYIDSEKVEGKIHLRYRRSGDKFVPLGMKGSKKLKDYFIDEKIPKELRDKIPLVCDEKNIIWIVGYRINNNYRITSETNKVLYLKYE